MLRWLRAAGLAAVCLSASSIAAAASNLESVEALGLPKIAAGIPVYHSPSAAAEAKVYAETLDRAVAWYRKTLGGTDPVVMAVLDRDHYAASTPIPYPVPHAEVRTGLVIMPDRIDEFPGFDRWDLEPVRLNAALTLHEIGHVIAHQTGIWSRSAWVNELVANVFLAGYARAERPEFAVLLGGVPRRFTDAGVHTSLDDFDVLYSNIGLRNYAWFQFRFAALADYLVGGGDFATVVDGLRSAFPAAEADTYISPAEAMRRLETIRPGATRLVADLAKPSALPEIPMTSCADEAPDRSGDAIVIIENRSARPFAYTTIYDVELEVSIQWLSEDFDDAEKLRRIKEGLADFRYAETLDPGERIVYTALGAGTKVYLKDGGCFIVPAGSSRFAWTGPTPPP